MATVIQIKRSVNDTAPSTSDLSEGELAYSKINQAMVLMRYFTLNQLILVTLKLFRKLVVNIIQTLSMALRILTLLPN